MLAMMPFIYAFATIVIILLIFVPVALILRYFVRRSFGVKESRRLATERRELDETREVLHDTEERVVVVDELVTAEDALSSAEAKLDEVHKRREDAAEQK